MAQTAELLLLQDTRLHTDSNGSAMPFPCDCTLPVYGNGEAPAKQQEAVIPQFIANPTIKFNLNHNNTLYHNQNHNNQPKPII